MSQIDRLPDELIIEILKYAMIRDTPFDIVECTRVSKSSIQPWTFEEQAQNQHISLESNDVSLQLGVLQAEVMTQNLRRAFKEERLERASKRRQISKSEWPLYDATISIQQPHLLDWRLAGSVCQRFRKMGKVAFWTSKTFSLNMTTAKALQNLSLTGMSIEDQRTALRYINSIILIPPPLHSPSSFITLPNLIAGFSALKYLDFYLGERRDDPVAWLAIVGKDRMQPPAHFIDVLITIGVLVEKLDAGILINPSTNWSYQETLLKNNIYPMLKLWASWKNVSRNTLKGTV